MDFNYDKFLAELQAEDLVPDEAAHKIYQEIRKAENQRASFLDQATENPDFYTNICSQVETYITYLKALHNKIAVKGQQAPDEQEYLPESQIINQTLELVKYLEEVEQHKLGRKTAPEHQTNLNTTSPDLE